MRIKNLLSFLVVFTCLGLTKASSQTYCTPSYSSGCASNDLIDAFSTTGGSTNITNNSSGCNGTGGYVFNNTMTHTGIQNTNVNFAGTVGSYTSSENVGIFVDWNHNGSFLDANENVYVSSGLTGAFAPFSGTFLIPPSATPGMTRMRVICSYAQVAEPCNAGLASFGECEDYNFMVVASAPCTGTPTAGTAVISATNVCSATPITLSVTGSSTGSGINYQWQTGPSATGPWTNIGTASISSNYNTVANATAFYRATVTCGTAFSYTNSVQVTVPALFPGGTYTINGTIPASSTNFQTFGAAVSAISCGTSGPVIFNVNSATYTEQVTIPQINTNSATNTITFNGNGATLTYAASASATPYTLGLNGADYFTFNNLNFVGTGTTYALVGHLWNGADRNNFNTCTFTAPATGTSTTQVPFSISGSVSSGTTTGLAGNNNLVSGCTMSNGYYNTCIVGNSGTLATGNRVINSTLKDFYYYGSYNYYADSTVISGNDINRLTRASTSTFYGIYLTTGCKRSHIVKNRIHDPFAMLETSTSSAYCIYAPSGSLPGDDNRIINNAVYNIKCNGLIYGMYFSGASFKVYHNSIVLDHTAATAGTVYGIYDYDYTYTGAGTDIRNNIIFINRGGTGTKYCFYYYYNVQAVSNNNIAFMGSTTGSNYMGYLYVTSGVNYNTLADWQAANGGVWDGQSYSANPNFVNTAAGNLKPLNNALDNKGASVGILTDLNNMVRVSPPDIGAVEFGSDCPSAANLTASTITGTTATLTWSAASAIGYEYVLNQVATNPTTTGTTITGTTLNATNLRPLTTYYFHHRVKCDAGGYSYWITISFTTTCSIPSGRISPSIPTRICQNQPILLSTDTATYQTYQWTRDGVNVTGATSSSYVTSTPGLYRVIVNMGTCNKTSDTVRLTLDSTLLASITYTGSSSICQGGRVTLTSNTGAGFNYQWLKDGNPIPSANSNIYGVEYTGSYQVRITSSALCPAISDAVNVTVADLPNPQITRNGNVLSTVKPYATYQWYKYGQPIAGATSSTYTFTNDASYTVSVSDAIGCSGTSSNYLVNFLSIGNVQASDIAIYPNPAYDVVSVSSPIAVNIEMRSMDGKVVMSKTNVKSVDVRSLTNGLYMIYVSDKDKNVLKVEKLVKSSR